MPSAFVHSWWFMCVSLFSTLWHLSSPFVSLVDLRCWYLLCWVCVLLRGVSGKSPLWQISTEASKHPTGHIQPRPSANRQTRWGLDSYLFFSFPRSLPEVCKNSEAVRSVRMMIVWLVVRQYNREDCYMMAKMYEFWAVMYRFVK